MWVKKPDYGWQWQPENQRTDRVSEMKVRITEREKKWDWLISWKESEGGTKSGRMRERKEKQKPRDRKRVFKK